VGTKVKVDRKSQDFVPTISSGAAYTAGDAVGSLLQVPAANGSEGSGTIRQAVIMDQDGLNAAMDFFVFNASITATADNDAFAPSEDDLKKALGVISVAASDYADTGNGPVATKQVELDFQMEQGTDVFIQPVTRGTPTYTGTDNLKFTFVVISD